MKLWRVILSIHLKSSDGLCLQTETGHCFQCGASAMNYSYTTSPATFYVHAVSASDAQTMAIALVSAGVSPYDKYRTSGSLARCYDDSTTPDGDVFHEWNDMERAA